MFLPLALNNKQHVGSPHTMWRTKHPHAPALQCRRVAVDVFGVLWWLHPTMIGACGIAYGPSPTPCANRGLAAVRTELYLSNSAYV